MNDNLYNKTIQCPVCKKNFEITKVKTKATKVLSRDTDFCVYYDGLNPMFYDVWVCENCGYAAQGDRFEAIIDRDADKILKGIAPKWNKRSFSGERTLETALETFKLALLNLHVRGAKPNEFARICIRIAWMYRLKKDEKENEFIKFALNSYDQTYQTENFPVEKLDEFTCMYMIGELNRRTGNYDEAVKWLSRLISKPEARRNTQLLEAAREQFHLAKEQAK